MIPLLVQSRMVSYTAFFNPSDTVADRAGYLIEIVSHNFVAIEKTIVDVTSINYWHLSCIGVSRHTGVQVGNNQTTPSRLTLTFAGMV